MVTGTRCCETMCHPSMRGLCWIRLLVNALRCSSGHCSLHSLGASH